MAQVQTNSFLSAALAAIHPFEAAALDAASAYLKAEKATVLGYVDKTITGEENQIVAALVTALHNAGGVFSLFAGSLGVTLTPVIQNLVTQGEADLAKLYDEMTAYIDNLASSAA